MKDKEKQIEEMAKITCTNVAKNCIDCEDCSEYSDCILVAHAINLYDDNYRKIPKDSVVLSREEYEELKTEKDFNYGYHEGERNMEAYYENIKLPEERKETAEKILNEFTEMLKEKIYEKEKGYIDFLSLKFAIAVDIVDFENCLEKTLNEFIAVVIK